MSHLPGHFVFELTRRCNHNCLHCYTVWSAPGLGYPPEDAEPELSAQQIIQAISRLEEQAPLRSIALSGGEPLLKDGLSEIVAFILNKQLSLIIITNGSLLTEERARALGPGIVYEIPLLSYKHEVHDRLSGRIGAWENATEAIVNAGIAGSTPVAAFVATKLNYADLFKTGELAIALGAQALMYNRMNLSAHNLPNAGLLLPTPSMIRENLNSLEALSEAYGLPVSVSIVIEPCVVDLSEYSRLRFVGCPLCGENSYFTIDPAGNIRICNHSPVILGNILRDDFREIFYNNEHVERYRRTTPEECLQCSHPLKEQCRGGCRAASEQCLGGIEGLDPFVAMSKSG